MADWQSGLFALPCGVDFAAALADGLIERMADQPPEAMAGVTVYVNSGRTMTALREAFQTRGPGFLPRMLLIADIGGGTLTARLARRLELGQLIDARLKAQPDLASGQSVPELADSLADLMAEMQLEGLTGDDLDRIDASDHAQHWARSLAFLKIAASYYMAEPAQDREARLRQAADRMTDDWANGRNLPQGPVVVAGSTGSHGATRDFMMAVARLPQGAVVLPGYDPWQSASVWSKLDSRAEDHPQARHAPFIAAFGEPQPWTRAHQAPDSARNRLISLALRPAPVTDQWVAEGPDLGDLIAPTQGITLIEAEQPGQEAEAIALIMREAAEEGRELTLLSPDRGLLRRVSSALDRWSIIPDDSAGRPLALTSPGLYLRHVASLFGQPLTVDALLVLLKHPLTHSGAGKDTRREHQRLSRDLELELRRHGPAFPDAEFMRQWGSKRDETRRDWAEWLAATMERLAPLAEDRAPRPLTQRLIDLVLLAGDLASGPGGSPEESELWKERPGREAKALLEHLRSHAHLGHDMRPGEFADFLTREMNNQNVREDAIPNPLIHFRGPREARTEKSPLLILAGLNEGGWPQALAPDPWLSRPMRLAAGLTLPERRIGLAAHDFQQAVAAPQVILTRARRDAEAETIPSRWLNRLVNLLGGLPAQGGKEALAQMRKRGQYWLDLAELQGRPRQKVPPAERPSPIPPVPALQTMSVTEVRTLIRDPYAVYARRVLGLNALPPLRAEPDPAERGTVLHEIVQGFLLARGEDTSPEALKAVLMRQTDAVLEAEVPWPSARLFWRARIAGIADRLVKDESERLRAGSRPIVIESRGKARLAELDFTLTAQPDRIDVLPGGFAQIYDYKSGKPPTDKQIAHFDKQLPLEAAMAERGAFDKLGPTEVAGIAYIQLGGEGRTENREFPPGFADQTWDGFTDLITKYLRGERGFTARLAMEQSGHASDYDHLSRMGEWAPTEAATPQKIGDHEDG